MTSTAQAPAHSRADARFAALAREFATSGYAVARGLLDPGLAVEMRMHFMALRAEGPKPGDMGGDPGKAADPLNRFPRMVNMHAWDARSAAWSAHSALTAAAGACIGQDAELCQTML